ncbi:ABC transporter substrate-binding protein [Bradyrhizobium barranii subsp. apii]|uniref:ABC transporter substrate-binding protein n=1 Tax=Bradyrhizobium barranii subsp. apii TaxID=2819348 RepID=A0A8U0FY86_9BRAD|nr:ABC transporter substrate-binding protein [Bradyrhizobium barranii]UPT92074.1 ABC transporter substrate-binding protein [Bradyrhizobium barranii subsp. apii]
MKILAGATLLGVAPKASAQKVKSFTVAYLALLAGEDRSFAPNFLRRLDQLGYIDGKNLHFVYRSAEGRPELLPGLASDLIRMKPDVLVTGFGTVAAKAGKAAGNGIPVVFMAVGDPVGAGVVASLARPGGNVTGLSDLAAGIQGARLQLLREIVPAASLIAAVLNPGTPYAALAYRELETAARVAKIELRAFEVRSPEEIAPQLEASKVAGAGVALRFSRTPSRLVSGPKLPRPPPACVCPLSTATASSRKQAVLRHRSWQAMAARRGNYRPHPQRREAGRHPRRAADHVRACHQSQDGQGLEHYRAGNDPGPC